MISRWTFQKRGAAVALVCGGLWMLSVSAGAATEKPPVAEKKPVTDEYHGTKVVDDYQWLEKADDPAVKAWVAGENKVTRDYLEALPDRKAIAAQLTELYGKVTPRYYDLVSRPAGLFALKFQPPKQQPMLVVMPSADEPEKEKVVIDPNTMGDGGKTAIDWFVPSPDGKLVAVSLSQNGSEDGSLYFYKAVTGEKLADVVSRVQYPTGGGSAAWMGEEDVYYTRYPHAGERPETDANFYQQIYHHRLGSNPSADDYVLGKEFPRIAEITLDNSENSLLYFVATVANGDGGEFAHYLLKPHWTSKGEINGEKDSLTFSIESTQCNQFTKFGDKIKAARFGPENGALYLLSVQDAPHGKILRLPEESYFSEQADAYLRGWKEAPDISEAKLIVPEDSHSTIENLTLTAENLLVTDLVGGPSRVRRFSLDGSRPAELPLPSVSNTGQLVPLLGKDGHTQGGILLSQTSYTTPQAWLSYNPTESNSEGSPLKKTALAGTSPVDFSDIEAVREFAVSKDGTKVPLNILKKKGTKLDGNNPTLLYGYGGYNISMTPNFVFTRRLWFDRGGVYVVANIRGGGEFGEEWHQGGNLLKKQNVFDDFAAAAEYLIKTGYTKPEKLAVEGGSNGGLLMGAFLTQHPDLARAVVTHVGIYDMLRVELDPNGAFNVTEFGTVKDPAQFKALHDYSPYHHVTDGTKYPAILFMTGDNDGRVNPLHSRKMTARLQAASGSDRPILLRTTANAGHGMGTALGERIEQEADADAFLFDQLGMKSGPSSEDKKAER